MFSIFSMAGPLMGLAFDYRFPWPLSDVSWNLSALHVFDDWSVWQVFLAVSANVALLALTLTIPKIRDYYYCVLYFFFARDVKARQPDDVEIEYNIRKRKRIVLIRHGESIWNEVFNRGLNVGLFVRLTKYLWKELQCLLDPHDSALLDSPLSARGVEQTLKLLTFIESHPCEGGRKVSTVVEVLRGQVKSIVCSSILRCAMSTTFLTLSSRFLREHEDLRILSCLQEMSRNMDAYSLARPHCAPQPSLLERHARMMDHIRNFYHTKVNAAGNQGGKTITGPTVSRVEEFASWVFDQDAEWIIVGGHSHFFRNLFKAFLPKSSVHVVKEKKIAHCGVIAFDLYENGDSFRIDPGSIQELYGGFTK
eukprot:GEMP01063765.1.p1 GENE.GEMP01063765.1~~GEMP01063765.1.p1  ORF type:complete len:365 (-),score=61.09 GEMP01063765.1:106-1200(-)